MERGILDSIRRSYVLKFLFSILFVVGLIGAVGIVTYLQTTHQLETTAENATKTVAELDAIELDRWLSNRESNLQKTADDDVYEFGNDAIDIHLRQQYRVISAPDDLLAYHYVQRDDRRVIASAGETKLAENETVPYDWYGGEMRFSNGVYISPVYTVGTQQRIALVREVSGRNTLIMELNFSAFVAEMHTPSENSFITIADEDGTIVGGDATGFVGRSYSRSVWRDIQTPNDQVGFLKTTRLAFASDTKYLVAYAAVPDEKETVIGANRDMTVVVHVPQERAYELSRNVALNLLIIVGVALFGLGLLGATLVRGTVRDLDRLTSKTKKLERGDLDVELDTDRKDELGQLYERFASMRDRIQERIAESQSARAAAQNAKAQLERQNESLRKQQTIISVLNRVLRHNIRNGLAVLQGSLSLLPQESDDEQSTVHIERMQRTIRNIEGTAEKARAIEQVIDADQTPVEPIDVTALLRDEIAQLRDAHPDATIETDLHPDASARVHRSVRFVFTNVIENAVEHNDSESPRVWVSLDVEPSDRVVVTVTDTGPGIPATELETLESGAETATEHGSGLGLWVVMWLVSEMNGAIEFEDNEPRGTVVTIELESPGRT